MSESSISAYSVSFLWLIDPRINKKTPRSASVIYWNIFQPPAMSYFWILLDFPFYFFIFLSRGDHFFSLASSMAAHLCCMDGNDTDSTWIGANHATGFSVRIINVRYNSSPAACQLFHFVRVFTQTYLQKNAVITMVSSSLGVTIAYLCHMTRPVTITDHSDLWPAQSDLDPIKRDLQTITLTWLAWDS